MKFLPITQSDPAGNRAAIEAGLFGAGIVNLPSGLIPLDRSLQIGPEHAGCTLSGAGPSTVLRNVEYTGNGANATLMVSGKGISYIASGAIMPQGNAIQLAETIPGTPLPWNHPSAQTELLKPGNVVYAFEYDSYLTKPVPPRARYVILAFCPSTRVLTVDRPPDPSLLSFKWMDGPPIADVFEGDQTVLLLDPNIDFRSGECVYVTSGPSLANSSVGEYRRVVSCYRGEVTLDEPLTRDYKLATIARVRPALGVKIKDLTVGQPVNPQALCQLDATCDLTFERVTFHAPNDPGQTVVGLNACGVVTFLDCTIWGGIQLNACHDIVISGGMVVTLEGEEGTTNCAVHGATIRLDPRRAGQAFNGVNWTVGADRLFLSMTTIDGYGALINGAGGARQCPIIYTGRGLELNDVRIVNTAANCGSYINSEGGVISHLVADTPICLTDGKAWHVCKSSTLGWELRAGTTGVMHGSYPLPGPVEGWSIQP